MKSLIQFDYFLPVRSVLHLRIKRRLKPWAYVMRGVGGGVVAVLRWVGVLKTVVALRDVGFVTAKCCLAGREGGCGA